MYEVKLSSGKILGPFNAADLKDALQDGRISGDDFVCRTDGGDFVPIRSVRGLKDLIQPTGNTRTPASTTPSSADAAAFSMPPNLPNFPSNSASTLESGHGSHPRPIAPPLDAGDKVLRLAFAFGRWFSILMIVLCILVLANSGVTYMSNSGPDVEPEPIDQTIRPVNIREFIEACRAAEQNKARFSPTPFRPVANQSGSCLEFEKNIAIVNQSLGLNSTNSQDVICAWISNLPEQDQKNFANQLTVFAQSYSATIPKPANCDGAIAAVFFHDKYVTAIQARELEMQAAEFAAMQENERRKGERLRAKEAAIITISTLLVFLFFPLLIQIERNTRPIGL